MLDLLIPLAQSAFPMGDVLAPYIYVFYAAFSISFLFTPIMRMIAMHFGIVDSPDGLRKVHREPVAYLGGAAVFLGWLVGLATSQFLHLHRSELGLSNHVVINIGILAGAVIIVLLGLWDDVSGLDPWKKISGQIVAASILLYQGIGTRCASPLLDPVGDRLLIVMYSPRLQPLTNWLHDLAGWPTMGQPFFSPWVIMLASSILVVLVVVACCNATNLMDGLDGLCGGVTAIMAAGFLFIAIHLAATGAAQNGNLDGTRVVLGLALLGGILGFVPYNFNPASIFMGDTGSMFLGFCCAVMIILMGEGQHPKWFLASMVIFALPVLDTALAFARRYINKRPFFSPDRHHIHHQLVARGFTVRQTVLLSYALAIFFALLGCMIVFLRTRFAGAVYLFTFGCVIVAAVKMGMVHEKSPGKAGTMPRHPLETADEPESEPETVGK